MRQLRYFDAFAGIGGFSEGIQRAIPSARCIGYSEINKAAIQIYEKHYPNHVCYGNITEIRPERLPDFDLFCFGFPCVDVSISGKRTGLCGTRSGLFFEAMRIIRKKQPRIIFAENVPGLLSSDKGWDFARVLVEMDDAGYDVEWTCENSKNYGVAQNRLRVYIIGHLRTKPWREIFPLRKDDIEDEGTYTEEQGDGEWFWDVNSNKRPDSKDIEKQEQSNRRTSTSGLDKIGHVGNSDAQGNRVYSSDGVASTLSSVGGGLGGKTGLYDVSNVIVHSTQTRNPNRPSLQYSSGGSGHLQKQDGTSYCLDTACSQVIEIPKIFAIKTQRTEECKQIRKESMQNGKDWCPRQGKELTTRDDELMNTLTASWEINQSVFDTNTTRIRRLTPLETERLQGFQDFWTKEGIDENGNIVQISDSQRYACVGNSVTVPVIESIVTAMKINLD